MWPPLTRNSSHNTTFALVERLFDNYSPDQKQKEFNTPEEAREVDDFLEEILKTQCMKILVGFYFKGISDRQIIKNKLKDIWFKQYNMGPNKDLSGFEHCVVGEMNEDKVSGYHFWYKVCTFFTRV